MNPAGKSFFSGERLLPWIIPAILATIWTVASESGLVPGYLLPGPGQVLHTAYDYAAASAEAGPYSGRLLNDLMASLLRVAAGFGLAALLGLPLGILSGRALIFQRLVSTTINGLRAVPGISWLPLALVWFGIGFGTTIFLVALAAFFPIYLNTAAGARQIDPIYYQAGAMMGVGRLRGVFAILIPAIMPQLMTGLRLGLGIAWAYLVLGELTGVPDGLGAVIMDARMLGRIDMIMVGVITIAVMGRLSDSALKAGMRLCFKSARRMA